MITKEQWLQIEVGDILQSPSGALREVINIFNGVYVEFEALREYKLYPKGKVSGKTAAYLWSDIHKNI